MKEKKYDRRLTSTKLRDLAIYSRDEEALIQAFDEDMDEWDSDKWLELGATIHREDDDGLE